MCPFETKAATRNNGEPISGISLAERRPLVSAATSVPRTLPKRAGSSRERSVLRYGEPGGLVLVYCCNGLQEFFDATILVDHSCRYGGISLQREVNPAEIGDEKFGRPPETQRPEEPCVPWTARVFPSRAAGGSLLSMCFPGEPCLFRPWCRNRNFLQSETVGKKTLPVEEAGRKSCQALTLRSVSLSWLNAQHCPGTTPKSEGGDFRLTEARV